ncbi:MAG: AMP-binding protein [Rhodobacteraceae bacterium]|nr:AMP-binding protein [Paracoccaceae bacterium]
MDISVWIERHAGFSPDKTAIRFEGADLTYRNLARRIGEVSGVLRQDLKVGRGDRVAWLGLNHSDLVVLLFACARLGAIVVPMNWRLEVAEYRALLEDCTPKVLATGPGYAEKGAKAAEGLDLTLIGAGAVEVGAGSLDQLAKKARPVQEAEGVGGPTDAVLISYTSGTTGKPKGVLLDQHAIFVNAVNSIHMHTMTASDVVLNTLPMFHVGGMNILSLPTLRSGGLLVLHAKFDVDATFRSLERDKVNLTVLVPTQITALLNDPRWASVDLGHLRMISTGSSMVPQGLITRVHERGVPVVQVYGSTETGPIAAYLTADLACAHVGSAGLAAIHCGMRIVDETGRDLPPGESGEILIKGENLMRGYWQNPDATARALVDGWFHTDDVGHVDAAGFLYVDDRKKDMVISGGENIYPAELENLLAEHPGIAEVAVIGQPDEAWGEIVVAMVVAREAGSLSDRNVIAFLDGKLARYKHPRKVIFVDALPRNTMGKVIKDDLRKRVARNCDNSRISAT